MNVEKLLKILYGILPEELDNDKFLQQFWDFLYESLNDKSFFIGKISLSSELFQKLDNDLKNNEQFLVRDDGVLMRFMVFSDNTTLFTIKYHSNVFHIEVKVPLNDAMLIVSAIKNSFMTRIETLKVKEDNGLYELFECDIKFYDKDYNEIYQDVADLEKEKDMIFAAQFAIPLYMARFFRLNFDKYKKQLNSNLASYLMELDNRLKSNEMDFLFSQPFTLDSLEDSIIKFKNQELINILRDAGMDESIEVPKIEHFDISFIKNNLLKQIGEGRIVMSSTLISDLYSLLEEKVTLSGLVTSGYVIKKESGYFTLFRISIKNGIITIMREEIKDSDIELIFNSNPKNALVEGLKSFFFDSRGLK